MIPAATMQDAPNIDFANILISSQHFHLSIKIGEKNRRKFSYCFYSYRFPLSQDDNLGTLRIQCNVTKESLIS